MAKVQLKINVDQRLLVKLEPILAERGLTLDQTIGLFLRGMVNASDSARALRLADAMPFGKFRGEDVETLVRAEPNYVRFLLGLGKVRFDVEVLQLLEALGENT